MPNDIPEGMAELVTHIAKQKNWYWQETEYYDRNLSFALWLAVITGIISTVLVAFPRTLSQNQSNVADWVQWTAVLFTACTTALNGSVIPRYRRLLEAREAGRIASFRLELQARLSSLASEQKEQALRLIDSMFAIETAHGGIDKEPVTGNQHAAGKGPQDDNTQGSGKPISGGLDEPDATVQDPKP